MDERIAVALIYGWVTRRTATARGDIDLLVVADNVTREELSAYIESRFDLAFNAACALAVAALRKAGYRLDNRYIVFQCLRHTLSVPNEQWRVLDQAHRKRNLMEYEGEFGVEDNLLEALLRSVELLADLSG